MVPYFDVYHFESKKYIRHLPIIFAIPPQLFIGGQTIVLLKTVAKEIHTTIPLKGEGNGKFDINSMLYNCQLIYSFFDIDYS